MLTKPVIDPRNWARDRFTSVLANLAALARPVTLPGIWTGFSGFESDRIKLFAQPIYPIDSEFQQPEWFEILIRLVAGSGSTHSPSYFIPLAERHGQIGMVDSWVIAQTLETVPSSDVARQLKFSINMSGASLQSEQLRNLVLKQVSTLSIDRANICFEITETSAIHNLPDATRFIERVRAEGCQFALDDFGSGLSSFTYLKHLPVDYIKMDGSFVQNLENEPNNLVFIRSICTVASELGLKTVAECVESLSIVDSLASSGIDFIQGYSPGRPQPLEFYVGK